MEYARNLTMQYKGHTKDHLQKSSTSGLSQDLFQHTLCMDMRSSMLVSLSLDELFCFRSRLRGGGRIVVIAKEPAAIEGVEVAVAVVIGEHLDR